MATKIQDVDIRLVLARLRPHSAYHWVGLGDTGNTLAAVQSWRDPDNPIPTEPEVIQEWDQYQTETEEATADLRELQYWTEIANTIIRLAQLVGNLTIGGKQEN